MRGDERKALKAIVDRMTRARLAEKEAPERRCETCGGPYIPKVSYQRYCRKACASIAHHEQKLRSQRKQ